MPMEMIRYSVYLRYKKEKYDEKITNINGMLFIFKKC